MSATNPTLKCTLDFSREAAKLPIHHAEITALKYLLDLLYHNTDKKVHQLWVS